MCENRATNDLPSYDSLIKERIILFTSQEKIHYSIFFTKKYLYKLKLGNYIS